MATQTHTEINTNLLAEANRCRRYANKARAWANEATTEWERKEELKEAKEWDAKADYYEEFFCKRIRLGFN